MSDANGSDEAGASSGSAPRPAPDDARIVDATARLDAALVKLEAVVDDHLTHHLDNAAASAEVQRLNSDRARIARSLDEAEARAARLDEANREVSRRLVGAMEAIRGYIEKQS